MRITFAIKALGHPGGGAERVLVRIASGLACRGHDVSVISSDAPDVRPYYSLDKSVRHIAIGVGDTSSRTTIAELRARVLALRKAVVGEMPDVAIGFMHSSYLPLAFALIGRRIPVIASEHTVADYYEGRPVERLLLNLSPLLCNKVTVISDQSQKSFGPWLQKRMIVVPNPVHFPEKVRLAKRLQRKSKVLLCVGRLAPEKGQSILVQAFSLVHTTFPEWHLRIVGDGQLRDSLAEQVQRLGLAEKVTLVGARYDVGGEYASADLFVVPSIYEGFGLVTAEALSHGLPVIGFADCPGTNILVQDDVNGRLVAGPDRVRALADALSALMGNSSDRTRLADSPRDWIQEKYGISSVLNSWESIIVEVAHSSDSG